MTRDLLEALWTPAAAYGELRFIKKNGTDKPHIGQEFVPLDSLADPYREAQELAREYDRAGWDVYFGCLRRQRRSGTSADVVQRAPVLWADVDPYKPEHSTSRGINGWPEFACHAVLSFPIAPSIIVDSGNGIHAYWLLRDAAPVGDASLVMKGIAKAIGGDHTHDPARVLRLPGTSNHKDPLNLKPVRLLRLDTTRRYRFSDFAEYMDLVTGNGTPAKWHHAPYERRAELPPWLDDLIFRGAPQGTRSEQCFKAMVWLIRYGWTPDEVRAAFDQTPNGIGEKMAELNGSGARWFDRTFQRAEAVA